MANQSSTAEQLAQPSAATRQGIKSVLSQADGFDGVDRPTRREIAHSLVRIAEAAKLLEEDIDAQRNSDAPLPPQLNDNESAGDKKIPAKAMNAGDAFSGTAVDRIGQTTRNVLEAISFPRFVAELINGVFKAMVDTNQQQLQQYLELIRGVSQSLDGFASLGGNDDAARRWLVQQFPTSYAIDGQDEEEDDFPSIDDDDDAEPLRIRPVGSPPSEDALRAALSLEHDAQVPTGGAESLVPFVRRALAKNRQGMLATMIRMGMQRIVIDSGKITAGMRFHIDATSAAQDRDTSSFDTRHSIAASGKVGFGWWSASASMSSTIGYVRTNDTTTSEDLSASADLTSRVELNFRTDQVPLDRLASREAQKRLGQNSLNPDRETELMLQAEAARQERYKARDTARASRQAPSLAPGQSLTPPNTPNIDLDNNSSATRANNTAQNQGGQNGVSAQNPAAVTPARNPSGATNRNSPAAPTRSTPATTTPNTPAAPNGDPPAATRTPPPTTQRGSNPG